MRKLKIATMLVLTGGIMLQLAGCGVLIAQTIAGRVVGGLISSLINSILDSNATEM